MPTGTRANSLTTTAYNEVVKPINLPLESLAEFLGVTTYTIRRWNNQGPRPQKLEAVQGIGVLAATVQFLQEELSFTPHQINEHLLHVSIDPDTCQAVTELDQLRDNSSAVIQRAIEASIER